MAVSLCVRSSLRAALLLAALAIPQTSIAQGSDGSGLTDADYYGMVASQSSSPVVPATASDPVLGEGSRVSSVASANGSAPPAPDAAPSPPDAVAPTGSTDDRPAIIVKALAVEPGTWAIVFLAMALGGLLLWASTPLHCLLFGHRRSKMSVRFDEQEQRWVGNCKSCRTLLARDGAGAWRRAGSVKPRPIPQQPREQEPIFVFAPERKRPAEHPERVPASVNRERPAVPLEVNVESVVSRLLDDVRGGSVPMPGTRGALFSVVDELRARVGPNEHTLCAEKISIRMQQLECALQRGDKKEAKLARRDLNTLAGEWTSTPVCREN